MPWNPVSPIGTSSVRTNRQPMAQNTKYIQDTMNIDHFWSGAPGVGIYEEGHHRFAQMQATNDANKNLPTNAALATGMDLAYFNRFKTPGEATSGGAQNSQPYTVGDPGSQIMQLLGIRAMAVFDFVAGGDTTPQAIRYSHNVTSILRQGNSPTFGRYSINFTTPLPSSDYAILGGGIASTGIDSPCLFSASSAAGLPPPSNKNTLQAIFLLYNLPGPINNNYYQGWIICFGG